MRACPVVVIAPPAGDDPHLLKAVEDLAVEQFVAQAAIEAFDIAELNRRAAETELWLKRLYEAIESGVAEARHRATPVGMGHGNTRFSSPTNAYTVLYAAQDLPTALAEKVIRDHFQGKQVRVLLEADLDELV